ncbi:unnamed protein product [Phytophthora fragariaefolia]|uniref:Unnamed protein product n=1 Tax=Phytophthora fragariaefolia TaxID=1490495 RepID=A0A9W6Y396_9STRA|nr:unnamed protein product [Phytophthora fragariaefolia]
MSTLCQRLQSFWALHAQDEAAALVQSSGAGGERAEVSCLHVRQWQQEVKAALGLGGGDWEVVGINVSPFSIEETALMLLVAEERRWVYVPLDAQLPVARQLEMARSVCIKRLVTTAGSPLAAFFASSRGRDTEAIKWSAVDLETSPFRPVEVLAFPDLYFQSQREESLLDRAKRKLEAEMNGDSIAAPLYVLFTSGTTGKPRGVLGTRLGAWTRLEWMWKTYPFLETATGEGIRERVLRATKLSFVDSVWEILGAFLRCVPVVHLQLLRQHLKCDSANWGIVKSVVLDDTERFLEVMHTEHITRFTAIPSVLEMLLLQTKGKTLRSRLSVLRYILSSGESLSLHVVQNLVAALPEVIILNLYEVSGDVTCMELKEPLIAAEWQERGIPIADLNHSGVVGGDQTCLLVVSDDLQSRGSQSRTSNSAAVWCSSEGSTKDAITGMLYISGSLVSLGYIGDYEKDTFVTLDALLNTSESSREDKVVASTRWLCTGDVCSVIEGHVYLCGRRDNSIKVNGQRVYLEAVERSVAAALKEINRDTQTDGINDSAGLTSKRVIAVKVTKEIRKYALVQQCIVACVICDDTANASIIQYPDARKVNTWISEHYGVSHAPHQVFLVPIDAVQRVSSGKIDRQALEAYFSHNTGDNKSLLQNLSADSNGRNTSEQLLARLLKEILDVRVPLNADIPGDIRVQTFSELGGNSLLATLFVHELHEIFGSHLVKSHELLAMTVEEVLSILDSRVEKHSRQIPPVEICPVSAEHRIRNRDISFYGWNCDSESGGNSKRCKLLNSARGFTDPAECTDLNEPLLAYVSRYNQSSKSISGIYLPTCSAFPLPSTQQTLASSLSTPWVLRKKWRVNLKKCIDASPLVIQFHNGGDSSIWAVVGSHSAQLVCVDVQDDGREIWRVTLDGRIEACATLSVRHKIIYVGTYAGSLFALEMESGSVCWRFCAKETIKSSAVVIDKYQLVVFGAYDGNLYGLNMVTGQQRWIIDLQGSIFSTPLSCGWSGQFFAATTQGCVVAFQFVSLSGDEIKKQWVLQLSAPVFAGLNADCSTNMLLAGCADGNLYGISMSSGDIQWRVSTEKPVFSSPCVYHAGSVVFGSHDGMLRKVDSLRGKLVWSTNLHGPVFASPTVVRLLVQSPTQSTDNEKSYTANDRLICCVTTTTGHIYFCDERTGSIIYQTCDSSGKAFDTTDRSGHCSDLGPLFGSPVLVDGWCLIGTRTNVFFGFEIRQTRFNES